MCWWIHEELNGASTCMLFKNLYGECISSEYKSSFITLYGYIKYRVHIHIFILLQCCMFTLNGVWCSITFLHDTK